MLVTLLADTYWRGAPWLMRRVPPGVRLSHELLRAADFREIGALYWQPASSARTAVVAIHPRVDFSRHYAFEGLLRAGIACLGANTRHPHNDIDTVHEEILLDVGACVQFLRDRGVVNVVLLGNSGGGSLVAMYQSQAKLPPGERIARAPSGAPTRLSQIDLPAADAMIYVAAHPGQGRILGECIDPAVRDEQAPLERDPSVDMYDPANGFVPPPGWSAYDDDFVTRFREAQAGRVRRLDELARAHIARQRAAPADSRERCFEPVMTIYRTMANLHYVDRRLDPNDRKYGSLLSERPDLMNMQLLGFARVCTPRAWLSTWSAASSNADMLRSLPLIDDPTLMVHAGRDREIYPISHCQPMERVIAARDATVVTLAGARHYFEPEFSSSRNLTVPQFGEEQAPHRDELAKVLVGWIRERFEA